MMGKKAKKKIKVMNSYSGVSKMEYGIRIFRRMQLLKSEGKSYEEATRIAKSEICRTISNRLESSYLRRWYNINVDQVAKKVHQHDNAKLIIPVGKTPVKPKNRVLFKPEPKTEPTTYDPWHEAKIKQNAINQVKKEQRENETILLRHPISCIECKIDFKSFGGFADHMRDVHHASVSTPKLILMKEVKAPAINVCCIICKGAMPSDSLFFHITSKHLNINTSTKSAPIDALAEPKATESFSDKWIRLFSEKGYNYPMVEAFKRDAIKQKMKPKQIHEFLLVCKPSKHPVKTPIYALESTIAPEQCSSPADIVETLVEAPVALVANDTLYAATVSDSIEQALFADRIVRTRTNQNDFKERIAANFCYRCAITDSGEALEAAHIEPVGSGNNNTSNGILMLACLHRLFDAGLMAINPDSLTVHFKADCTYFAKSTLEGKKLNNHSVPLNKSGLLERWFNFND